MSKTLHIILAAVLLSFAACGDKGVLSTDYVITPLLQPEQGVEPVATADVKAYAFYGDTVDWKVASWEDAVMGVITSKEGEQTRTPDFSAVPGSDGRMVLGPVTQETFMVLVCYTLHDGANTGKMYAWRKATTLENMPEINVKVTFKPWQTSGRYTDARWVMFNDNPYVEPEPGS